MATPASTHNPPEKKEQGYIEIPLPKFSAKQFSPNVLNLALFSLLIVASYLLGMLTTKVQYLEKGQKGGVGTQQTTQAQGTTAQRPTEPTPVPPEKAAQIIEKNDAPLPVLGDEKAKVTIVEFSDFQCPFCKQYFESAYLQLKKDYIDTNKVAYQFRHYPLSFHPNAEKAAETAECINEQGKFWEGHDLLFSKQTEWESLSSDDAAAKFAIYASELGLDATQFQSCLSSGKYAQKIQTDQSAGTSAGVSGTPTIFVNGKRIVGAQPFSAFKTAIDEALSK